MACLLDQNTSQGNDCCVLSLKGQLRSKLNRPATARTVHAGAAAERTRHITEARAGDGIIGIGKLRGIRKVEGVAA